MTNSKAQAAYPPFYERRRGLFEPIGKPGDFFGPRQTPERFPYIKDRTDIGAFVARDHYPLPHAEDRENYYHENDFHYWLSGLEDFIRLADMVPALYRPGARILDFGGASGRFLRHCAANLPQAALTLADININHIDWVERHFEGRIDGVKVPAVPPLPFGGNQFDLVTGFSVFTHLDQYEIPTLRELIHATKPGGYLYLSIHSDYAWDLLPNNHINESIKNLPLYSRLKIPGPMPAPRVAFPYSSTLETYNCHIFLARDYIRSVWGRYATVEQIIANGHGNQDGVLLRKN